MYVLKQTKGVNMTFLEKVKLINKINERMKKYEANSINYILMENAINLILENLEGANND